jgi:lipopolysaccharide/colanic/teichoic acid biosynthesis glycosyltransferase
MEQNKKICVEQVSEEWFKDNISENKNKFYLVFKLAIDMFFGCAGFIFFILLFPITAVLIKIDSNGNILYKQERIGKNGKKFILYKFRTMTENGREYKDFWREKNKENITYIGSILRKTHLDEIPQAINLLKRDLSFIGPRPEWIRLADIFEKEIPYYKYRYIVMPGIIGWAQINFPASKSVTEAKEKFEYDLYYIKNQSFLLDLEIILKSFKLFFQ